MARISLKIKGSVIVQRQTVSAGPFMAELMFLENGKMHARSLAPTRKLRRRHEKVIKKVISEKKGETNEQEAQANNGGDNPEEPRQGEGGS